MIIVSQDKGRIFNFRNLAQIYIFNEEKKDCEIRCETVDSLYEILGIYKTEKRAKEVLQEILRKYSDCNNQYTPTGMGYVINKNYKMPEE